MNEFLRKLNRYHIDMRTEKDSCNRLYIYFNKGDLLYYQRLAVDYACEHKMKLDYILNEWLDDFIDMCIREGLITEEL